MNFTLQCAGRRFGVELVNKSNEGEGYRMMENSKRSTNDNSTQLTCRFATGVGTAVLFDGDMDFGWLGAAVSNAGDVNGDGYADILVGEPYEKVGLENKAGKAYLIFGKNIDSPASFLLEECSAATEKVVVFENAVEWDYVGWSLSSAGDVNGDGCDDFLVEAPGAYDNTAYILVTR